MKNSSLKDLIIASANRITMHHYRSQPMPVAYSKPFRFFADSATPSVMQQAFMSSVLPR